MRRLVLGLLTASSALALASAAFAADLRMLIKAPPPVISQPSNGFIDGAQVGFNWQSGIVAFGVECESAGTNAKGKTPCLLVPSCESKQSWMATAAARLGLADGRKLYNAKGGAAWSYNSLVEQLHHRESTEISRRRKATYSQST